MQDELHTRFNEAHQAVVRAVDELVKLHVRHMDNDLLEVHGAEVRDLIQDAETLTRRIDRLHTDVYETHRAGEVDEADRRF